MTAQPSLAELAGLLAVIERQLSPLAGRSEALSTLTGLGVGRVPGAEYAGVTQGSPQRGFRSAAVTSELVTTVDEIQYATRSGPCIDAITKNAVSCTDDLTTDPRWPLFGPRAFEAAGITSMMSFRLYREDDPDVLAGLNLYSRTPAAFDESSEAVGLVLATAGALALGAAIARERAANLELAVHSRTDIGIAMGVLMIQLKTTREGAFDILRLASQALHRKLVDIAREVADTGALPDLPPSRTRG